MRRNLEDLVRNPGECRIADSGKRAFEKERNGELCQLLLRSKVR